MSVSNRLFASAALLALMAPFAAAQDVATDDTAATTEAPAAATDPAATELPVEVIETEDGVVATTEGVPPEDGAATTEMAQEATSTEVTDVETTSATTAPSLEGFTYDELYANGISINEMVGADVYGPNGTEDIGDVENVLFDTDGNILSVVAEVGGFLELGDTHVNIPWDMVSAEDFSDGIVIPFTEDTVQDYVATAEQVGGEVTASEEVAEVGGDGLGDVETGANVWRATDLLNGSARMQQDGTYVNYGIVNDLVVQDGRIAAVLVTADPTLTGTVGGNLSTDTAAEATDVAADPAAGVAGATYAFPYAGTSGLTPGVDGAAGTFDLPYDMTQTQALQPFDPAMLAD